MWRIVLAAALAAGSLTSIERRDAIHRARVWAPTNVASMNIRTGPPGPEAFEPGQHVACSFIDRPHGIGSTLKFACEAGANRELKVRYGAHNGEVFAQVAATRLLWALGFAANRMYPVVVTCRGCSANPFKDTRPVPSSSVTFDPATIDVALPGKTLEQESDQGWSWRELDLVDERAGGAPVAQRDALKLLAVLIQHSSNKPPNQRLLCADGDCTKPVMMITDLGKTFGRATQFNDDKTSSVNFHEWAAMAIWNSPSGCVGNLPGSLTGTLHDPAIGEAGRAFLSNLLSQLTDEQLRDLFEVARFTTRDPGATVANWVDAFKRKRAEIASRRCAA